MDMHAACCPPVGRPSACSLPDAPLDANPAAAVSCAVPARRSSIAAIVARHSHQYHHHHHNKNHNHTNNPNHDYDHNHNHTHHSPFHHSPPDDRRRLSRLNIFSSRPPRSSPSPASSTSSLRSQALADLTGSGSGSGNGPGACADVGLAPLPEHEHSQIWPSNSSFGAMPLSRASSPVPPGRTSTSSAASSSGRRDYPVYPDQSYASLQSQAHPSWPPRRCVSAVPTTGPPPSYNTSHVWLPPSASLPGSPVSSPGLFRPPCYLHPTHLQKPKECVHTLSSLHSILPLDFYTLTCFSLLLEPTLSPSTATNKATNSSMNTKSLASSDGASMAR